MSSQTRTGNLTWLPAAQRLEPTTRSNTLWRNPIPRLLAVVVAVGITASTLSLFVHGAPATEHYATAIGGQLPVRLQDGSIITLNTDSSVDIRRDGRTLSVQIFHGEVHFNMAPNPHRHLVVVVGNQFTVRDVGTIFDVRLTDEGKGRITVQKGEVEVSIPRVEGVQLHQNQQAVVKSDLSRLSVRTRNVSAQEIERQFSWLQGHLYFECTTLADAAKEFNRYNLTRIDVMDDAAANVQLGGMFSTTDPITFAEDVTHLSDNIRLRTIDGPAHTHILQLRTRNVKIARQAGCTAESAGD
jgi:transmembrane sensor